MVAGYEIIQVGPLDRVGGKRMFDSSPIIIEPDRLGPAALGKKQHVSPDTIGIENPGRQTQDRV